MTTKGDIRLLFEYDRWASNRVLQAAYALSSEQFTRDLHGKWTEVGREPLQFVNNLGDDFLGRMFPFRGSQIKLAHLMNHVANHSTNHRGQVALMMRQLDAQPSATDFHVFLMERRETAAH
jgi:uncharacterized damage-inducible protein DinB